MSQKCVVLRFLQYVALQLPYSLIVYAYLQWPDLLLFLLAQAEIAWSAERRLRSQSASFACDDGCLDRSTNQEENEIDEEQNRSIELPQHSTNTSECPKKQLNSSNGELFSSFALCSLLLCTACFAYLTFVAALPFGVALQFTAAVFVHCDPLSAGSPLRSFRGPAALELTVYICGFLAVYPALQQQQQPSHARAAAPEQDFFLILLRLVLYFKVRDELLILTQADPPKEDRQKTISESFVDVKDDEGKEDMVGSGDHTSVVVHWEGTNETTFSCNEEEASDECSSSIRGSSLTVPADIVRLVAADLASLTCLLVVRHSFAGTHHHQSWWIALSMDQIVTILFLKLSLSDFLSLLQFDRIWLLLLRGKQGEKSEIDGNHSPRQAQWWVLLVSAVLPIFWSVHLVYELMGPRNPNINNNDMVMMGSQDETSYGSMHAYSAVGPLSWVLPLLVWLFSIVSWLLQEMAVKMFQRIC